MAAPFQNSGGRVRHPLWIRLWLQKLSIETFANGAMALESFQLHGLGP
jgi:hypothetical protein